jgi:WhiB family redox-sensing transcriptional regulator
VTHRERTGLGPWGERRGDVPQPDWTLAACRGCDPNLWHPSKGEDQRPAKQICARCPIREGCAAYAIGAQETFGIWGGMAECERKQVRHRIRLAS